MKRKRQPDITEAVKQARSNVKIYRARAQKLLKRSEKTLRQYRHELATLKKAGIVSKRISARSHLPTRYMMKKLRSFADVAVGHAKSAPLTKLSPHRARSYVEQGLARVEGKHLIVPKMHEKETLRIKKGHLTRVTSLENGKQDIIMLPFTPKNMGELVAQLRDKESEVNKLKGSKDQFGFQIFGNNSLDGMPDAEHLANYIEHNYSHILTNPRLSASAVRDLNFVLIRFRLKTGRPTLDPYKGSFTKYKPPRERPNYLAEEHRKQNARNRKAEARAKETEDERERRLSAQRERDRKRSNDRREQRMADRLMPRRKR